MKPEELASLSKNSLSFSLTNLIRSRPDEVFSVPEIIKITRCAGSSVRGAVNQLPEENKTKINFRGRISNIVGTPAALKKFTKLVQ